jgi:hypothetical protein
LSTFTDRGHLGARPVEPGAAEQGALRRRWRPLAALLGLILIAAIELFGIAALSQTQIPDVLSLLSCAACHD